MLTHADGVDPDVLEAIHRLHEALLDQQRAVQQPDRSQVRPRGHAGGCSAPPPTRRPKRGRSSRRATGRRSTPCSTGSKPVFFDPDVDPILTNKSPGPGQDLLLASANNLYDGVSMADLEGFDEEYALNSRLVKRGGALHEEIYRIDGDGRYADDLREVVRHLEAAIPYASEPMAEALQALITWYRTGHPRDRRAYDIAWVADQDSPVDTINGFTEVYMDARGAKGAWEALRLLRQPREDRGHPNRWRSTRSGSRTACRGILATARPACAESPRTPSTSSSRSATRVRSRRSASTCRTISRSASSTAASRSRCRTSSRPTTFRGLPPTAPSSPGTRPRTRAPSSGAAWPVT